MEQNKPQAAGLKWRKRKSGIEVPYWVSCDGSAAINLSVHGVWSEGAFEGDGEALAQRCRRLAIEQVMATQSGDRVVFDGTFGRLIDNYLKDPESDYHTLKPGSLHPYTVYSKKLKQHIGDLRIEDHDGRDVRRWFKIWAGVDDLRDSHAHLPRARFMLTIMKKSISFGVECRMRGCAEFQIVLSALEFPSSKRRKFAPTAADVEAAARAAHEDGSPLRALLYKLQFETTARQWDLIGQWFPLSDPRPSFILHGQRKWIGPTWSNIDKNMILHIVPTKTEDTTEAEGHYDLKVCPMVMAEISCIQLEQRTGPLIIHEATGKPYIYDSFRDCWRRDFAAAELPAKMWNRDLRAGGSTEGSKAGASREDRAKMAGHSVEVQAKVYDRDLLEAHRRVARARTGFRSKNNTET